MQLWTIKLAEQIVKKIRKDGGFVHINDIKTFEHPDFADMDYEDIKEIEDYIFDNYPDLDGFYYGNALYFGDREEIKDYIIDARGYY